MSAVLLTAPDAQANPIFARKYKVSCNTCHTIFPQLNRFGRDFRDNGFRMPEEVKTLLRGGMKPVPSHEPGVTQPGQAQEDFWKFVPDAVPIGFQGNLQGVFNPKGDIKTDFQVQSLQLHLAGTFTPRVSFYVHHHLVEDGEPGDLYVGWVRFNNLGGTNWLNLSVGQSELPLSFSPEIERMSSFEYLAFGKGLGANPFTLGEPQIGATWFGQSTHGTKMWAGVANGFGLALNEDTDTFDNNNFKDVYGRVAQEMGEQVVGAFAYYGRARGALDDGNEFSDRFMRVGADAFFKLDQFILYGTALYARDDDPLGISESRSFTGGFVEGDVHVTGRTALLFRFDAIHQKRADFIEDVPEGEVPPEFRVNTYAFTPGVQFLVRPNVKFGIEYQVRQTRAEDRGLLTLHIAF
jgi:hypothetical protein